MIYFRINTEPVAKARPRFAKGHTYTPKKTTAFEQEVKFAFMSSTCETLPVYEKGVPVIVKATFAKRVPKSYSPAKRDKCLCGEIMPTARPDLDNYLKAVLDAVNDGYAYADDSQVVKTICEKIYAEKPYIEVRMWSGDEYERLVRKDI